MMVDASPRSGVSSLIQKGPAWVQGFIPTMQILCQSQLIKQEELGVAVAFWHEHLHLHQPFCRYSWRTFSCVKEYIKSIERK